MSEVAVLCLYPLWAVALGVAAISLRLGRAVGRGVVALCACLAVWALGLTLTQNPQTQGWAAQLIPSGMLLAGGFVHAFVDVAKLERRGWLVACAWGWGAAISALGFVAPQFLFDPATSTPGPGFWAVAIVSTFATLGGHGWMLKHTLAVQGHERRRRGALLLANLLGALGGGFVIVLEVVQWGTGVMAAPFLFGSIALVTWSVLRDETGRHGELVRQGLWSAVVTAALSAVGLTFFVGTVAPLLMPANGVWLWGLWVFFIAALPLDPLRQWVVEGLARKLFSRPMGVGALTSELEQTEQRAVHAEQLAELGRVASVVAHEVRNPLGVILAQTKLLEREGVKPERIADVRDQIARASKFVDELLRYAKPRAFTVARVELKDAVERAVSHVRQALGTQVTMETPASGFSIEADQQAVVDALVVLLSNAAIALGAQPDARIVVSLVKQEREVALVVEDNGPGVPAELAPRLFELFATGRGRDHAHPGVGLGLAIARQHALRHGGSLSHEAVVPHGARFTLRLPA